MTNITAFVGHSFTEDDEAVVANFLRFFDTIKETLPNFEWKSARAAEPKELAAKVLELTETCNTFIAICTRKELVASGLSPKRAWLRPREILIPESEVQWKTSDWIIQELGLAVGRKMSVIILLEEGCRRPGGLQGNVEFIPFSRAEPEKAQRQILEMLNSLTPATTHSPQTARNAPAQSDKGLTANGEDEVAESVEPDETWDSENYKSAFLSAMLFKEKEQAAKIEAAFQSSKLAEDDELRAEWLSYSGLLRIRFGGEAMISDIRQTASEFPENPHVLENLAQALEYLEENTDAIEVYEKAASLTEVPQHKAEFLASTARLFAKNDNLPATLESLDNVKGLNRKSPVLSLLPNLLKRVGESLSDDQLEIEAMEAIAKLYPDNEYNRFELAYAHSNAGNNDMALYHYLAIPHAKRSDVTWNNIGVAFQELNMPAKAVDAYTKAADNGETLAMSNLAYKLMQSGFLEKARELIALAMKSDEPHRNIGEAYVKLNDLPADEQKKLDEVLSGLTEKKDFFRLAGEAIQEPNLISHSGEWEAPNCQLEVKIDGHLFSAIGEYQAEANALALSFLSGKKSNPYTLNMSGRVIGRRVYGKIERTPKNGAVEGLLRRTDQEKKFLAIFDAHLTQAAVAENIHSGSPNFFVIKRLNDEASTEPQDISDLL